MTKRNKIIYWIATLWASLGMTATAIVQLFNPGSKSDYATHLGYPVYFLTIIGVWKILGVITILIPKFPILKEWAYAGFFFIMTGAILSHLAFGDPLSKTFPSLLLLTLVVVSWSFRPTNRKVVFAIH